MSGKIDMMNASLRALMHLFDGETDMTARSARIVYNAFAGWDEQMVRACCDAICERGYDGVLVSFDPRCVEKGPVSIVVCIPENGMTRLQRGRLWMTPRGDRAVLVPHDAGKVRGHYVVEKGRIVYRNGWPAETLERGTRRAEARFAKLTARYLEAGHGDTES
jgi:hypothetical protein